ncbi:hypothetical protein A0127_02390 [Thermococcus peptonophilus]|uniref:DNA cytosine methyltransferase n=1 Tax=Thermococcus peptonophilus TaxID=53952 RepID=A0A142CTJ7_9EURY|nr:hypothetical protein A0127_02390 [Thermococcus peptonophilus]
MVLGDYTIKFSDISIDYSQVSLTVQGPTGAPSTIIVPEGSNGYYPDSKNPKLVFGAAVWSKDKKPLLYLDIKSPLKKVNSDPLILSSGRSYTLPVGTIKVYKVTSTEVTFIVYLPDNPSKSITLKKGESGGVAYSFPNTDLKYYDFVYVNLLDITGSSAKFDVYMPEVTATKISVNRAEGSSSGSETSSTTTLISLYDGLLYTNEKLTIIQNKTKYELQLVSAVSTKASIKVYKDGKVLDTYIIGIGAIKDIPGTPLKVLISKSEPQYGRVSLTVYGPEDAKATPILRPANIAASIDTVPKRVMVGQDMVIIVTVENKGKGDAYDVNVAAPVPNGFKLVSSVKSWTFKSFPAFTKMPALIYVLQPTKVGKFDIGRVMVTYYDDQSLETGKQKVIYSQPLSGIIVYGLPEIEVSAVASNGTHEGNYVHTEAGKQVLLRFNVSASEGDPNYEFIKNATLQLIFPEGISGEAVIPIGDLKAGSSRVIQTSVNVADEGTFPIGAELVYQDPVGNVHSLPLGNLVTINSVPPVVITKEVKVWPEPDELPEYINKTLASMDNATPLAERLFEISKFYLPPENKSNPWKPAAVIFLLVALVAGALAFNYWNEVNRLREKLMRKKQRRPGGLPKKEEETEEITPKLEEIKKL